MNIDDLTGLQEWFVAYTAGFLEDEPELRRNVVLKIKHSALVAENSIAIAVAEGLDEHYISLAAAAGILHDTGRFPQFRQYRTFKDSESVNHGTLGAEVIEEQGVIAWMPPEDQKLVLAAVRYHNANSVPDIGDPRAETFIRLVRDADKLDIWRVFLEEYLNLPPEERSPTVGMSLPSAPAATPDVVATLLAGRQVTLSMLRNDRDIILMIVSWCYDLNFPSTWRMLLERGYLDRYASHIDGDELRALWQTRDTMNARFGCH